ncbi:MAG: hypothetical protein JXL80_12535 [Planctomycetes bacterium]|nr:hypothetical protein [Planctomycetota bacterium]
MTLATRNRLVITAYVAALALPIAYAIFVDDGKPVRYWGAATLIAIWIVQFIRDRRILRRPTGNAEKALTIFVEPVAWTGLKWAYRSFVAAAEIVGLPDRVEMFQWSSAWGAIFVLPDLMGYRRNLRHAQRLANRIARHTADHPESPVHLVTYSSGGFIALEALRRLPPGVRVRSVLMQTATVSRGYDLRESLAGCDEMINVWSPLDWPVNGFGALIFGANDRRHDIPAGTLPFRADGQLCKGKLRQIRWRPALLRYLYFGEHFTALALPWVTRLLALQRAGRLDELS